MDPSTFSRHSPSDRNDSHPVQEREFRPLRTLANAWRCPSRSFQSVWRVYSHVALYLTHQRADISFYFPHFWFWNNCKLTDKLQNHYKFYGFFAHIHRPLLIFHICFVIVSLYVYTYSLLTIWDKFYISCPFTMKCFWVCLPRTIS